MIYMQKKFQDFWILYGSKRRTIREKEYYLKNKFMTITKRYELN